MKSFPKKYNPKDLRNRSKLYREKSDSNKTYSVFSENTLPSSRKLSYRDFFLIYLKDFLDKKTSSQSTEENSNNQNNISYEQLFIISGNQLNNISSSYKFFSKKNQSLMQVGQNKLERHVISSTKKYMNANHKILDSYSSSNHKLYLPDLDLYTYILEIFNSLWNQGKITKETKIGYRSFNLQTSIPSEKISRKKEKIPSYTLKYFIGTKGDALYVPVDGDIDVCCGDVALLVHPKDKRYNKYIGKNAIIPLCNRQIPIIGDDNVNIAVNNGIQRICPCADEESIILAKKFGLPMNIYAFNKQGLYTQYIHESAFIGKERSKYYNNIVKFIDDIGNTAGIGEKFSEIPYLNDTNERLIPYKIDQIIIDLKDEKQKVIDDFFENRINYSPLSNKISEIIKESESLILNDTTKNDKIDTENIMIEQDNIINKIKQEITDYLDEYLPDSLICNSQIPIGWKIPLIKKSEDISSFFDLESDCTKRKEKPLQFCFNYIVLSLIRLGTIQLKNTYGDTDEYKICEYDKFHKVLLENEKKIEYFTQQLSKITGKKHEYNQFIEMIENSAENHSSSIKDISNLIKNCKFLDHKGIRLVSNIKGITDDIFDPEFIQLCIPCYLENKGIKMNNQTIFTEDKKNNIFKGLLIQQLLLGHPITNKLFEKSYHKESEFLGNKELTKLQLEQLQREFFSLYGENPIRLNFLIDKTFDEKRIILNNIFLKQIRNATRLCIQKDFLPKNIEICLNSQPENFNDYDMFVLNKLDELLKEYKNTDTVEEYIKFFTKFKDSIQNIFFSWYLEILKINPTKNVQFVCSYFFNFLLKILYPLVPEFIDALQYISERNFILPINPLNLKKATNYNINVLYDAFIKIKNIKIECNIKQHEICNILIKSNPSVGELFMEHEQIFKNYFHISDIQYLRLHEQIPLGYEIFPDDSITICIQGNKISSGQKKHSIETIEKDIKNLEDKLDLIRQRIQFSEGEQRSKAEEEYAKTKEEMENLTIKYRILSSK